jgi:hypothetical protein
VKYPVTLMEREDTDHRVELVYHGPEARQQVTINVIWHSGEFPDFAFGVQDDQVLEARLEAGVSAAAGNVPGPRGRPPGFPTNDPDWPGRRGQSVRLK